MKLINKLLQKRIHNFPKNVDFNNIKIEIKDEREEEYLETHYYRIKKTLEILEPKPKDKVLEVGCDSGLFSMILKEKFDIELKAVEIVEEKIKTAKQRGINVQKTDIEKDKLPFNDNYFDMVIFAEVIEHLSNPLPILSEIKRVVKPTGTVIISTPNAVGFSARYSHLLGASPHHPPFLETKSSKGDYGIHHFEFTIKQFKDLLEKNGYKIEKVVFSRFNHQRRGIILKIIERLSLSKPTRSDIMIFKCKVYENNSN